MSACILYMCVCVLSRFSHVRLFVTPWPVAHQDPLSMGFSRQEYWSRFPCPPPGDLPDPGIKPTSLISPVLAIEFFTTSATWEARVCVCVCVCVYNILLPKGGTSRWVSEVKLLSCVRLFAIPWTVAYQAPLSIGFSRQECWSGLPFPSPGDLPNPGIEPRSPALQADALPSEPTNVFFL